ncbi:MAG: rhodanese domain-containing protein [Chloroflexi bacterium OLB14]|nr:MAG: rhodanese domain-containing protein [Chloroflexi bacterium OLB14]
MTTIKISNSLVSVQWLKENFSAENLIILDADMKPVTPVAGGVGESIYIPNSLRFDYDNHIKDMNTTLPHMMPTPEFFQDEIQKLGINQNSAIIVYDHVGIYASPRAWWMFRAMGHENVAVLDGGLPAWINAGYKTASTLNPVPVKRGDFLSTPQADAFVDSSYMLKRLHDSNVTIFDARAKGRFDGLEPEPRPHMKRGHIPNAVNIPFASVLESGKMKSTSELQTMFEKYKENQKIFYCGTGVTASIVALAAHQAGYENFSVYDGSWAEWGMEKENYPIEK